MDETFLYCQNLSADMYAWIFLQVAQLAGMPRSILDRAQQKGVELETKIEVGSNMARILHLHIKKWTGCVYKHVWLCLMPVLA